MLEKPIVILHNGNTSVVKRLNLKNCINIQDIPGKSIAEKATYQAQHNLSTHFCIADLNNNGPNNYSLIDQDLIDISNNFKIVKIITAFNNDALYLDQCWQNEYDIHQYLHCLSYGLSLADEIVFLDQPDVPASSHKRSCIFSPGRCGTYLLQHLLRCQNSDLESFKIYHHYQQDKKTKHVDEILHSKKIAAILRKNIFDQVTSMFIIDILGQVMLTTENNLEKNKKIIANAKPKSLSEQYCFRVFSDLIHFLDYFYLFEIVFNKDITMYFYEDLNRQKVKYIRNPYDKKILIPNYNEMQSYVDNIIQPNYNKILSKNRLIVKDNQH